MFREFAGLDMREDHLPDESAILRFRHQSRKNADVVEHPIRVINRQFGYQGQRATYPIAVEKDRA